MVSNNTGILPNFTRFVQVGRVAYIAVGRHRGKLCVIVDIIDQTRALIDGPLSGVRRHAMRLKWLHLTDFVIKISPSARAKTVKKAWQEANIDEKWQSTTWCKKLEAKKRKEAMTDFDRFKLMIAKKKRNAIVEKELTKLKKAAAKAK
ncbi:putative 60S ribosomal protein L14-like isoform X2 [Apostichopus japonicus]|uniref:Large ribosomal subunit protein eL14 n=1 Tax=Stichopus japonicus TaxID=307972 RepID=A0A2G8JQ92_STIJA|nr:putative 60S ribosomal protein L14-like isoform X2 [Apostichopus japonicus]